MCKKVALNRMWTLYCAMKRMSDGEHVMDMCKRKMKNMPG